MGVIFTSCNFLSICVKSNFSCNPMVIWELFSLLTIEAGEEPDIFEFSCNPIHIWEHACLRRGKRCTGT